MFSQNIGNSQSGDYLRVLEIEISQFFSSCKVEFTKKYVGVQTWKATHLPTLDIRVEQKGSLIMKKEKIVKKKHEH